MLRIVVLYKQVIVTPCGHPATSDIPLLRTEATSPARR